MRKKAVEHEGKVTLVIDMYGTHAGQETSIILARKVINNQIEIESLQGNSWMRLHRTFTEGDRLHLDLVRLEVSRIESLLEALPQANGLLRIQVTKHNVWDARVVKGKVEEPRQLGHYVAGWGWLYRPEIDNY